MASIALRLPFPVVFREDARAMGEEKMTAGVDEHDLVVRLRAGDERAFTELVDMYGSALLGVARMYVKDKAAAEEVVQETWLGVLQGIDRFEERSSLKTWIFRILTNRAKTRGEREGRTVPFSALAGAADDESSVDADRFLGPDSAQPGAWAAPPRAWPHEAALNTEALAVIKMAIEMLPDSQREVIRLRDVLGFTPEEVAEALEISDGNQRVLLHRARSKVRAALEKYLDPEVAA
jgi:RNA polymerase sigma-70 factor (ECF subfamily)